MKHSFRLSRRSPHPSAGAFTLLELVVVLAVALVVLAVLMPALSKARSAARRSICMSNLHQNGLAMFTYVNDSNQRFPPFFFDIRVRNSSPHLQVRIIKKTKKDAGVTVFNGSDLICPEDNPPDVLEIDPPGNSGPTIYLPMSYGYNIAYIVSDSPYDLIAKPAQHVTLYDGSMCSLTPQGIPKKDVAGSYEDSLSFSQFALTLRHLGSANATFADAHVASVSTLTSDNISIDPDSYAWIDSTFLALFN